MNPKYKIIWTSVAENDLKNIIEYISVDSPQNAIKILEKIKKKASNLYTLSGRGRIVPELQGQGILQYREFKIRGRHTYFYQTANYADKYFSSASLTILLRLVPLALAKNDALRWRLLPVRRFRLCYCHSI